MLKTWVEASSAPNEVVLDCFAGGGSTLVSAYEIGRYYIGIESDVVHYKKCVERMKILEEQKEETVEEEEDA